ncbi:MAG TPA: DUF1549 and DUF1553 domain-containing protein [Gemmataceae bacterium]|jgi:hypothetical protein|nr:DUF1549 and DUF1553 domain-containing protein [Gemmataceae bacterium]
MRFTRFLLFFASVAFWFAVPALVAAQPHWALQPVREPALPAANNSTWPVTPVDFFILAKLEANGLSPSPQADKRTLLRRISLDLTGLPPTPEEMEAFLVDSSSDAYEKVVERLLDSPRYGERWGRFWLDVARYADSKGYVFTDERKFPFSYTYRDYVIRAFNEDLPYNRFIMEQLAADQLDLGADKRPLAAMGFLTLGRRFLNNAADIIDDRIDVTTRGLLGLTVACARCHDHKYDPIPQADYYSLYGVFASSVEPSDLPLIGAQPSGQLGEEFTRELEKLKADKEKFAKEHEAELKARNRKFRDQLRALQSKIDKHLATHPGSPPRAMELIDAPAPVDPQIFVRGDPRNPGAEVPRQFLACVAGPNRQPFTKGSGRLELAKAIASKDNPLTARVFVNRLWQHHFGAGLVRTPSNFGIRGEPPTHPELLDWLASRFMAEGWSVKKLQRLIVLSNTYRQSSAVADCRLPIAESKPLDFGQINRQSAIGNGQSPDPENRLLSHMNRQKLDFEALRDSLLFVSGQLDNTEGGRPVELFGTAFSKLRTIYGFVDRQNLPGMMRVFDFASPDAHCPQRHSNTVPLQALYLMNGPFIQELAKSLVQRSSATGPAKQVERMYCLTLGRPPEAEETRLALAFLRQDEQRNPTLEAWQEFAQVLLMSNEFAFVD